MAKSKLDDYIAPIILGLFAFASSKLINLMQNGFQQASPSTYDPYSPTSTSSTRLNTTITENFLDDVHVQPLQNRAIWQECLDSKGGWIDKGAPMHNIWEELAHKIWESEKEHYAAAKGFEYWCHILTPGRELPWHIDKDEFDYSENGNLVYPIMGSVYYGFDHTFEGGYLETIDADIEYHPLHYIKTYPNGVVRTKAEFNRKIIFNATLWHHVSEVFSGERFVLAVNAWEKRPLKFDYREQGLTSIEEEREKRYKL